MCQTLSSAFDMNSSQWLFKLGALIILFYERKLRLREVTNIFQGHTAGKWQRWDLKSPVEVSTEGGRGRVPMLLTLVLKH